MTSDTHSTPKHRTAPADAFTKVRDGNSSGRAGFGANKKHSGRLADGRRIGHVTPLTNWRVPAASAK
jgi:hypothetical protein